MCSRRVIVAGASGFLGRACVASLLEKGYFVEGLCRERPSEYIKHEKLQMHCEKEWSPGVLHKILLDSYAVVNAAGLAHAHVSTQSLLFFESNAQLVEAMNDPRYSRDSAYRKKVADKLGRSNIL